MSCLARALGRPSDIFDRGADDIESIDGYLWSGSPARMVAVSQLVRLAGLPSVTALNIGAIAIRVYAASDAFRKLGSSQQLSVACELLDSSRSIKSASYFLRPSRVRSASGHLSELTKAVAANGDSSNPLVLIAALALVYASAWPDDPTEISNRLMEFESGCPHAIGAFENMVKDHPGSLKNAIVRLREQIAKMP